MGETRRKVNQAQIAALHRRPFLIINDSSANFNLKRNRNPISKPFSHNYRSRNWKEWIYENFEPRTQDILFRERVKNVFYFSDLTGRTLKSPYIIIRVSLVSPIMHTTRHLTKTTTMTNKKFSPKICL